jgi:2-polyprenyl-3-methyl-5-hydroxy-6-metoxy-1,4-benzoquinol methylase
VTTAEIQAQIDALSPWFYRFELGGGLHTTPAIPPEVVPIHETRLKMAWSVIDAHFGSRLASIDCLDVGSHEGFYSVAMAQRGVGHVLGLEPREDSLRRARFIVEALGLTNVSFTQGVVETLARDLGRQFDLTLFLGVLYHVPDPILCLKNVAAVTRELCVIETQVIDEIDGVTEWGSQAWTRQYHGVLALIDESGEFHAGNRETGTMPLVTCPSPKALVTMLLHAGFRKVEFVEPQADAYEQLARKKRVVCAAWK